MSVSLTRRVDDKIVVSNGTVTVTITFSKIRAGRATVSVNAPKDFRIEREDRAKKPEQETEPDTQPDYEPCRKCCRPGYGDAGGLCLQCEQGERGD